jgi:hypothetical protein
MTAEPSKILCVGARSVMWYLENAHPKSRVECVISPEVMTVDLASSPATGPYESHITKLIVHRGPPNLVLRSFEFGVERFETFDIVVVEHGFRAMVLAFDFLKIGGTMIIDGENPPQHFEAFLETHDVDLVSRSSQTVVLTRRSSSSVGGFRA